MSNDDYIEYLVQLFVNWHEHEKVVNGQGPETSIFTG
jgi:hypothetical protein